jgi:hypothetical protein
MDSIWASIKADWHEEASCRGTDTDTLFYPKIETESLLIKIREMFCDQCPVRAKCLNSALINKDDGFWGGTSTDMRAAVRRTRHRAKCPVCMGRSLIEVGESVNGNDETGISISPYQVCLSCGVSWRIEIPHPSLITENVQQVEAASS